MENVKAIATRQAFGQALAEIGDKYPELVVLDADLACSTKSGIFAKKYPERFFQMGIAEANMIGTAAGLALTGYTPFACSFAAFITGRYDQIRMSVSYSNARVRIVGTHAGVGIGEDGHSQMGLEDISCMRALPNMTVLQPADDIETAAMVEELVKYPDPAYIRLTRQNVPRVHSSDTNFKIGKMHSLKEGDAVMVLATGGVVHHALDAAKDLESKGLSVKVVNVSSIKPLDTDFLAKEVQKFSKMITIEDHYIEGGLGGAISEYLTTTGKAVELYRIGVEKFGQSGTPEALYDEYGLSAPHLAKKIASFMG